MSIACIQHLSEAAFRAIVAKVRYKDWILRYSTPEPPLWGLSDSYFLLYWRFTAVDYADPARPIKRWEGRKHYVPAFSSEEQVVRTAFLAAKLCEEHEAALAFNYAGVRVFDPHKELL